MSDFNAILDYVAGTRDPSVIGNRIYSLTRNRAIGYMLWVRKLSNILYGGIAARLKRSKIFHDSFFLNLLVLGLEVENN